MVTVDGTLVISFLVVIIGAAVAFGIALFIVAGHGHRAARHHPQHHLRHVKAVRAGGKMYADVTYKSKRGFASRKSGLIAARSRHPPGLQEPKEPVRDEERGEP